MFPEENQKIQFALNQHSRKYEFLAPESLLSAG